MRKEKLYAFWKYDLPPYILSGEILKFHESGGVFVKGYDQNMTAYFKKDTIIAILPKEEAERWEAIISEFEKCYEQAIQNAKQPLKTIKECLAAHPQNQNK